MIAQAERAALEEEQREYEYDEYMDPLAMQTIDRNFELLRQAIMNRFDSITGQLQEIRKLLERGSKKE